MYRWDIYSILCPNMILTCSFDDVIIMLTGFISNLQIFSRIGEDV